MAGTIGFVFGGSIYVDEKTTTIKVIPIPEYGASREATFFPVDRQPIVDPYEKTPDIFERITPPLYETLGVATLAAVLSFFVALLSIRGLALLGIWVVGGFREQ